MVKKKREKKSDISIDVGQAIAMQRKLAGFTQLQVAERLGVEKETISRLETGAVPQNVERLQQLSEVFNCPITRFFSAENGYEEIYAATIGDMIRSLPVEYQESIVRCVAELTRTLKKAVK